MVEILVRFAAKVDANQKEVVQALRKAGAFVQSLAALGDGVPDILVGYRGKTLLMEIKRGANIPSRKRLTSDQVDWHKSWCGGPLWVIYSPEQALDILKEC